MEVKVEETVVEFSVASTGFVIAAEYRMAAGGAIPAGHRPL
jgi:hypothetical protein